MTTNASQAKGLANTWATFPECRRPNSERLSVPLISSTHDSLNERKSARSPPPVTAKFPSQTTRRMLMHSTRNAAGGPEYRLITATQATMRGCKKNRGCQLAICSILHPRKRLAMLQSGFESRSFLGPLSHKRTGFCKPPDGAVGAPCREIRRFPTPPICQRRPKPVSSQQAMHPAWPATETAVGTPP